MQQISPIKEKILKYIDSKGISKYKFYQESGITRGVLDKESGISEDNIAKFIAYDSEINVNWLLTGEGEMFKTKNEENLIKKNDKSFDKVFDKKRNVKETLPIEITTVDESENPYDPKRKQIPLIPIGAMAGFGTGTEQIMNYDVSNYVVPEFTELSVDFMIRVKGSSMYPKYSSGDLVACKKLFTQDIFFQWNKVYVLDTEQGALIKRVKKGIDDQHLLLTSENSNYDSFELHLSKVYAIALVVGVIRLE